MTAQSLPWAPPLELAAGIREECWVLLYSSAQAGYSGRFSYLACNLAEKIEGKDFSVLEDKLSAEHTQFSPAWFGYLGYSLKDSIETLTPEHPGRLSLSPLCMMRFHAIYVFDHEHNTLTLWSDIEMPVLNPTPLKGAEPPPEIINFHSPMPREAYLNKATDIIERIHAGELYQANLTRKFSGTFANKPDAFSLFRRLSAASPAPYSAFLKFGDTHILSSSPERFLNISADGKMTTRPIKGTAPRSDNTIKDTVARNALEHSEKDRAENLMIVDLMRNDFSRCCQTGSVKTEKLFEVTTHATIHHLSSTVTGEKKTDCSTLDAVKSCFPPGSMTGAPKICAMNLCAKLEHLARGVYSGAIGWFGGDGSCDLSVVIRTLIVKGNDFEFQVGGGIVADSHPEAELEETFTKAKGLCLALNISPEKLRG